MTTTLRSVREIQDAHRNSRLSVGDECWLLLETSLYLVTVKEVRTCLEGDPAEFAMYRVTSQEHSRFFEEHSQHRADLFRRSDERAALLLELDERIDALDQLRRDITESDES